MMTLEGNSVRVETRSLSARFERGTLVELRSMLDGRTLVDVGKSPCSPLQLVYAGQGAVDVLSGPQAEVAALQLSPTRAEFRLIGWDADGVIAISEDPESGDLLVEPAAYSSRPGVLAVRWLLPGAVAGTELVAPFFQGVRLPLSDPLLQRRWFWPQFWEAGLAIFQHADGGFWVHSRDDRYRYKALTIENSVPGFETEAYGPAYANLGAGGLTWRIGVYRGDWQTPASVYRDWLWAAYGLAEAEQARRPWTRDIRLAVSWYGGAPDILDAIAERIEPGKVLIHFSDWRTDAYDENYPTYVASHHARQIIAKANTMGFHIMPHCNSVDMDPTHPAYALVRDFQYRDVQTGRLLGWGWDPDQGGVLGVPNSYRALAENRRRKVMVKVHPGLAMWRSILAENVRDAVRDVGTDAVFLDVTLCSHNIHNCIVEGCTPSEGMNRLIRSVAEIDGGLAVGGEGLNEITMQWQSFAQAHLFLSWHDSVDGLERTGGCPLNAFLFGRLCRTFGYSRLSGATEDEALRMRIHESLGAIPTVTVRSAHEIRNPNAAVLRQFELARES
jgi:hypothetical protein